MTIQILESPPSTSTGDASPCPRAARPRQATQRLLDPVDDLAGLVLDGYITWSLLAPLVESGAPSITQPHHDALGITGPAGIAAVVHAEEDARAAMSNVIDVDLLTHRGPPPYTKVLCVPVTAGRK